MNTLLRNKIHKERFSHEVRVVNHRGLRFKITYEVANAYERYWCEIFDNGGMHTIFTIMDLGESPNDSAYAQWSDAQRERRAEDLYLKAVIFIKALVD